MKLPPAKAATAGVFHELYFLLLEAIGLAGAALIIEGLFKVLEVLRGNHFPEWLLFIPYCFEIAECAFFVVICGSLHLTRMGLHLKEIWASVLNRSEPAELPVEAGSDPAQIHGIEKQSDEHV